MREYIVNPRRAPRAPSRCVTQVRTGAGAFAAETEDIGPSGCQLVAPGALARGALLTLTFANPKVKGALSVEGTVAWGSQRPPWRVGVAFGERSQASARLWYEALVAAHPGLGGFRRVPDRLPVDAMVFLAAPPSFLFDFSHEEVEVLRHVAAGITIASLRDRLGASWGGSQRALFSLKSRGAVTVSGSAASHPSAWKQVMKELKAEFVQEAPAVTPRPSLAAPPPPPLPLPLPRAAPPPVARPTPLAVEAVGGEPSAGNGWRGGSRARSAEAQEYFDLGRAELAAGRGHSAMAHLRRALQLAPGDAEVAAELGRAMTGAPPR